MTSTKDDAMMEVFMVSMHKASAAAMTSATTRTVTKARANYCKCCGQDKSYSCDVLDECKCNVKYWG